MILNRLAGRSISTVFKLCGCERVSYSTLSERQKSLMSKGLPKQQPIPGVKNIILVSSGKGGVGKSTTAVNIAVALSVHAKRFSVGILDADIYGPSIPKMMNLSGEPFLDSDNKMIPLVNYGIQCMSIGFLVDEKSAIVWRGPMLMSALNRLIRQVKWSPIDFLVVDMPPGTGDTQLTITQLLPVTGAVIVTTPQDIALLDARRGADMYKKVDIPVLGFVQNMSQFVCPNCNHVTHIFGQDGAKCLAEEMQVDFLGDIPLDINIRETADCGRPIAISQPESTQALSYRNVVAKILDKLS